MTNKATTATEWIDDLNTMLLTFSPDAADIVAFAKDRGAIAGHWVWTTDEGHIAAENGWDAWFDASTGRWS